MKASRNRWIALDFGSRWILLVVLLWCLFFFTSSAVPAVKSIDIPFAYFVLIMFVVMGLLFWLFRALPRGSVIYVVRAHERQSFWQRNQGEIVKGLTSGGIGAILGYLIRIFQTSRRP